MLQFLKDYHLPQHLDIVFMLMIGILLQIMDGSPFTIKERWKVVWETDLPAKHFSPFVQKCIKTLLSLIVLVRCTTTYAYVVAAMLVIFCILKKTSPKLMRLWLLIAGVKSISMIFLEGLTGVYVCSAFGKIRKACVEFFIVKALELIFSTYLWGSVLNIYKNLEKKMQESKEEKEQLQLRRRDFGRLRARSLVDESTLSKTAYLNSFERRDVPLIILQMLRRDEEMSEDSLLAPGMMLASVSNLGSFDNIKTSQSLGELGFTDLTTAQIIGLEEDENLSNEEKALRFLKLTRSDVRNITLNKCRVGNEIYNVGDDIWKRVVTSGIHVNQPKQPRTEVFIRKISPADLSEEKPDVGESHRQLSLRSLFSYLHNDDKKVPLQDIRPLQDEQDEDRFDSEGQEEDNDRIFMSNLKDGSPITRINMGPHFKKMKGIEYANLYKQPFMSNIGPEVFDKASKLPKLTSFTKIREIVLRPRRSMPEVSRKKSRRIKYFDDGLGSKTAYTSEVNVPANTTERSPEGKITVSAESSFWGNNNSPEGSTSNIQEKSIPVGLHQKGTQSRKEETEKEDRPREIKWLDSQPQAVKPSIKQTHEVNLENQDKEDKDDKADEKPWNEEIIDRNLIEKEPDEENVKDKEPIDLKLEEQTPEPQPRTANDLETENTSEIQKLISSEETPKDLSKEPTPAQSPQTFQPEIDNSEGKPKLFYKKRKILIRWVGQRKPKVLYRSRSTDGRGPPDDSNGFIGGPSKSTPEQEKQEPEEPRDPEEKSTSKNDVPRKKGGKKKTLKVPDHKQIYFVTELFKKPLFDVLVTYYDLKKRVYLKTSAWPQSKSESIEYPHRDNSLKQFETVSKPLSLNLEEEKNWKSEVLKRSNPESKTSPGIFGSYLNTLQKRAAIRRLLKYEYHNVMQKYNHFHTAQEDDMEFLSSDEKSSETDASIYSGTDSKEGSETSLNLTTDSAKSESFRRYSSDLPDDTLSQTLSSLGSELQASYNATDEDTLTLRSASESLKPDSSFDMEATTSEMNGSDTEGELLSSQESDEPISLYYSKAANLASPLLDMKGFIYPDHIHYSYKHVKKKGFDVDINGGFPLLMRESLTVGDPVKTEHKRAAKNQDCEITRRPMDLSFAQTNAFAEWQTNDQNDVDPALSETTLSGSNDCSTREVKFIAGPTKILKARTESEDRQPIETQTVKTKAKSHGQNLKDLKYLYQAKDSVLIEKLLKMHKKLNKDDDKDTENMEETPIQISSTQLHSNKGQLSPKYNPAIFFHENKNGNEKKKSETQKERTKDMFARLEREALLQNKAPQKPSGSGRNT